MRNERSGARRALVFQADFEIRRRKHKPAGDLNAYDCVLRAQQLIYAWTAESVEAAMRQLEQALKIDANYALANAMLANSYATRRFQGWFKDYDGEAALGLPFADRSFDLVSVAFGLRGSGT